MHMIGRVPNVRGAIAVPRCPAIARPSELGWVSG